MTHESLQSRPNRNSLGGLSPPEWLRMLAEDPAGTYELWDAERTRASRAGSVGDLPRVAADEAAVAYFGAMHQTLSKRYGAESAQARRAGDFMLKAAEGMLDLTLAEATELIFDTRQGAVADSEVPVAALAPSALAGLAELQELAEPLRPSELPPIQPTDTAGIDG